MRPKREAELRLMQAHEDRMSRPVREIFPRNERFKKVLRCRNCRDYFTWYPSSGPVRVFCCGECKIAYYASFQPSSPEAGDSGDGAPGK